MSCQADKLAGEVFEDFDVPPCDETATHTFDGYLLCEGCVEALRTLCALGGKALVALGDLEIRRALGESGACGEGGA